MLAEIQRKFIVMGILLCFIIDGYEMAHIYATKTKCENLDSSIIEITKCFTRRISRIVSETTVNVTLLEPVRSVMIRIEFAKKSNNKYNSYLIKAFTFDGCKFMAKRSSSRMAEYFYKIFEKYSNINHSCPYEDFLLVDRFQSSLDGFMFLPIPFGEYVIQTRWIANEKPRFTYDFYFTYSE